MYLLAWTNQNWLGMSECHYMYMYIAIYEMLIHVRISKFKFFSIIFYIEWTSMVLHCLSGPCRLDKIDILKCIKLHDHIT
jgi:hypothetical protein